MCWTALAKAWRPKAADCTQAHDAAMAGWRALAMDAGERWVTVKPAGPDHKGTPVKIDGEGKILAGMGGKFNGKNIRDARSKGKESTTQARSPAPETTAREGGSKGSSSVEGSKPKRTSEEVGKAWAARAQEIQDRYQAKRYASPLDQWSDIDRQRDEELSHPEMKAMEEEARTLHKAEKEEYEAQAKRARAPVEAGHKASFNVPYFYGNGQQGKKAITGVAEKVEGDKVTFKGDDGNRYTVRKSEIVSNLGAAPKPSPAPQKAEEGKGEKPASGALGRESVSSHDPNKRWPSWKAWNDEYTKILQKRNAAKQELEGSYKTGYKGNPKAQPKLDRWEAEAKAHTDHPNAPNSRVSYANFGRAHDSALTGWHSLSRAWTPKAADEAEPVESGWFRKPYPEAGNPNVETFQPPGYLVPEK